MANLITLQEYKDAENLTVNRDDYRIDYLIESVSQLVKTYCGNSIVDYYNISKVEVLNINWDTNVIQLTESPLVSVSSVEERVSYSSSYILLSEADNDYFVDTTLDTIYRTTGTGYRSWRKGPGAVRVTYNAGYADTPKDLKLAIIDLVTYYLKDEYKERKTLAGASMQNPGTSSQDSSVAFPDHIKRVLDLYKNF